MQIRHLFSILASIFFCLNSLSAQYILSGTYQRSAVQLREPQPIYYNAYAKDVTWSAVVWSVIDRSDKDNGSLFAPDNNSLIATLLRGVNDFSISAYYPYTRITGDELTFIKEIKQEKSDELPRFYFGDFEYVMTPAEVSLSVGATSENESQNDEFEEELKAESMSDYPEIKQILIKELWIYRKDKGILEKFLIGLAPVRIYIETGSVNNMKQVAFWVYYSDIRTELANTEAYTYLSDRQRLSLDDILYHRLFSAKLVREITLYRDMSFEEEVFGIEANEISKKYQKSINKSVYNLYDY